MRTIIKVLFEKPLSALSISSIVLVLGFVSLSHLTIYNYPYVPAPYIDIVTEYPDIPASEVEKSVTQIIEDTLSSVDNIRKITSITKEGVSLVTLFLEWGSDPLSTSLFVRERIGSILTQLPHDTKPPLVFTGSITETPMILLSIEPKEDYSISDISELVTRTLQPLLSKIDGVGYSTSVGGRDKEIEIVLNKEHLYSSDVNIDFVSNLIESSVTTLPLGTIKEGTKELYVTLRNSVDSVKSLENIFIPVASGSRNAILLKDVSESIALKDTERSSFFSVDNKEAIGIYVYPTSAGILYGVNNVIDELPEIQNIFKDTMEIKIANDFTVDIRSTFRILLISILIGIVVVIFVVLYYYRNFLCAITIVIPLFYSIATAFLLMYFAKVSINIISLTGIAVGMGMIFDNSAVLLNSILSLENKTDLENIIDSFKTTTVSLFGGIITTIIVFLPLALIPGFLGSVFWQLSFVVSAVLLGAFLFSFILVPVMYSLFQKSFNKITLVEDSVFDKKLLNFFYRRRNLSITIILILIIVGGSIAIIIPKEILPRYYKNSIDITIKTPSSTGLERTKEITDSVIKSIRREMPQDINRIIASAGHTSNSLLESVKPEFSSNRAYIQIFFRPVRIFSNRRGVLARKKIEKIISSFPFFEYEVEFSPTVLHNILNMQRKDQLLLYDNTYENIDKSVLDIMTQFSELRENILIVPSNSTEQINVKLNPVVVNMYPFIREIQIANEIKSQLIGVKASFMRVDGKLYPIVLKFSESDIPNNEHDIASIPLKFNYDTAILAKQLVEIEKGNVKEYLFRYDKKPAVYLELKNMRDKDIKRIKESNTRIISSDEEIKKSLLVTLNIIILALIVMYFYLGAHFQSFSKQLLLVLVNSISIIGSFAFLLILGRSLNINSLIGILVLIGTNINSIIILVDMYNKFPDESIYTLTLMRIRTIKITVFTTVLAILPVVLFAAKDSSEIASGLLGGLVFGNIVNCYIFPTIYSLIYRKK